MCTIIALHGIARAWPLVVAANRDEFYARPAGAVRLLHRDPRAIGGCDLAKGGTWMGANEGGFFVGLTNQRLAGGPDPALRSRGEVVARVLRQRDIAGADRLLGELDGRRFNSFNLLYGQAGQLRVAYARRQRRALEIRDLAPGLWVLANARIGAAGFPKTQRAERLVRPLLPAPWLELVAGLQQALADHRLPPAEEVGSAPPGSLMPDELLRQLQALCVHTAVYGTRSATIAALSPGRTEHYLVADGPPCQASFRERAALLRGAQ